jgi:signal transduction histidine kinase
MRLSQKLALSYMIAFSILLGITFSVIYFAVDSFRKDDFFMRLKNSTLTRYKMVVEMEELDARIMKAVEKSTVRSTERQVLIFDGNGKLIYNNAEDINTTYTLPILKRLMNGEDELKLTDKKFQLVGLSFMNNNVRYYGIARDYDKYGIHNMEYLRALFFVSYFIVTGILILLSFYLSRIITGPVTMLTKDIGYITPNNLAVRVRIPKAKDEIGFLAEKFNEMLDKVENAFKFQYHFIHHLSHELKTPLSVMLTSVERALLDDSHEELRNSLQFQKHSLMELSNIINAMIDVSKSENQLSNALSDTIRIDELLFECIDELRYLNQEVQFDFAMDDSIHGDEHLTVQGSGRMLKMAIMNLLKNAINYTYVMTPMIRISAKPSAIQIKIMNDGDVIPPDERIQVFRHLFRGQNSRGIKGFGLGLVLAQRIVTLHHGTITYSVSAEGLNCFDLVLPLHF